MDQLTAVHRRQLIALRAVVLRDLAGIWRLFDPDDRSTWAPFSAAAAVALTRRHGHAVALGQRYYGALRSKRLGLFADPNEVSMAPVPLDAVYVGNAMAATGLAGTYMAIRAGRNKTDALKTGFVRAGMSAGRLVLNGARQAVTIAARGDGRSAGWTRETASGKPCAWCASQVGVRMTSADVFRAHDGCACVAEPQWA